MSQNLIDEAKMTFVLNGSDSETASTITLGSGVPDGSTTGDSSTVDPPTSDNSDLWTVATKGFSYGSGGE